MIPEPPNYSLSLNSWRFHTVFLLLLEWYFYLAYPIMLLSYVGKKLFVDYMSSLLDCELRAETGPHLPLCFHIIGFQCLYRWMGWKMDGSSSGRPC